MRNKLLAGIAALAIGIGVASCGENEEPASKQSSSKAPETQQTAKQSAPAEPEGQPSGQTASQAPAGQEKQPESGQQEPRPQVAQQEQQPSTTQGQPPQQNTSGPSQSSAQSQTGPAVGQPQPNQLGQNQQATAAGPVNLTREQLQQAQTLLNEKGFNVGDVDGVLGPRTRRAVMAFQRQRGLEPSGQIDQQTATALGLSIASTSGRSVTGPQ
jgi:hypothetical protein